MSQTTLTGAIPVQKTAFSILIAISVSHLLNDMMQSLLPAIYPVVKTNYGLAFWQIGLLTFTFQIAGSLFQPLVGHFADQKPRPYSLVTGMGSTFCGLLLLSQASNYVMLIIAAAMIGLGSSVFHPESSRVARMASGGRHGLAQSIFQVGGNLGSALGPLLAALIVVPFGQNSIVWFSAAALVAMAILWHVGNWYREQPPVGRRRGAGSGTGLSTRRTTMALFVLGALIVSKFIYTASLSSYYTFYLIDRFGVTTREAQILLFVFLGAVALGTLMGGPIGDRIGRKYVIWISILGVLPFTLALPYANFTWTVVLSIVIGLVLSSAFSAIIVYAQELVPTRVGMIAGFFFGFAFGVSGIGAALLGIVADAKGIGYVYQICSFLPAIGLLTVLLPDLRPQAAPQPAKA